MKIDLHIHSKEGSDGRMPLVEIFDEAARRAINLISITDHDSIKCQEDALNLAGKHRMTYITGVEINISFSDPGYRDGKSVSLDCLGYGIDITNDSLAGRLEELREYRQVRAERIMEKVNTELKAEGKPLLGDEDIKSIEESVDGTFGRPHIADYLVKKQITASRQEAFDRYLVKCNVPKMPVSLEDAAALIRGAGGLIVLAHPNHPRGTSLISLTKSLAEQHKIIKERMLPYLDGVECWHSSHTSETIDAYLEFARSENLVVTGGSDCHQQPVIMGTLDIPEWVGEQAELKSRFREI
ncbi:MAG: PHP domain-containing protein [Desulfatiglandaceae bacterium]